MAVRAVFVLLCGGLVACVKGPGQGQAVVAPVAIAAPIDGDGDGFADDKDACPGDPGVAVDGCPAQDRDEDGLLGTDDRCPTEPENRNGFQDEDGCPDEIPVKLGKFGGPPIHSYFDEGKDTIRPKSTALLDRWVTVMNEYPEARLEISGHTNDREKSPAELSLRRAQAVQRYMLAHGIAAARVQVRGAGADEPLDTNGTEVGRAKNRRITFQTFGP